jgi:hypothetical protein
MIEPLKTVGSSYIPERQPPDDLGHVFLGNAVEQLGTQMFGAAWTAGAKDERWRSVVGVLVRAFRSGEATACVKSVVGGFIGVAPAKWHTDSAERIFRKLKAPTFGPLDSGSAAGWLFVERHSLDTLAFSLRKTSPEMTVSAPFVYDMSARRWRLFDAAIWVATAGAETTTAAIAAGNLDDVGCRELFTALAEAGYAGPEVTGLGLGEIRIPVMHSLWERAHTGWLKANGHRVRFYPDPEVDGEVGADLTMKNGTQPMWTDIRIDRDGLLSLFQRQAIASHDPVQPRPAKKGGRRTTEEKEAVDQCALWIVQTYMSQSPNKPTIGQSAMMTLARSQPVWGQNLNSEGAFKDAWQKALTLGEGAFDNWQGPGTRGGSN